MSCLDPQLVGAANNFCYLSGPCRPSHVILGVNPYQLLSPNMSFPDLGPRLLSFETQPLYWYWIHYVLNFSLVYCLCLSLVYLCLVYCLSAQSCLTLCDPRDCSPLGSIIKKMLFSKTKIHKLVNMYLLKRSIILYFCKSVSYIEHLIIYKVISTVKEFTWLVYCLTMWTQ